MAQLCSHQEASGLKDALQMCVCFFSFWVLFSQREIKDFILKIALYDSNVELNSANIFDKNRFESIVL